MITPEEIVKKAERKYRDVLRAHLTGEDFFPLIFPVGRLSKKLVERRQQIEDLRQQSKSNIGHGYALKWVTVNRRDLGKQTTPRQVVIETLEDYLSIIRRRNEFMQFTMDVERIRRQFPDLEDWLCVNPQQVIDYSGRWKDILTVCDYFVKHPRPNLYIRELPIPVHTKFIEQHSYILRSLLDVLLAADFVTQDAADFNGRFGLKSPPPMIRLRLLDDQLAKQQGIRLSDLMLPVDQLTHLLADHIRPGIVIIVENLINFITLPAHPASVGLFGSGFAVRLLAEVEWLNQCQIIYWGDIDAHGFQILSDLRQLFSHVCSIMMDRQTLDDHAEFVVDGNPVRVDRFDGLTESELEVAQHVIQHNLRLEQEHISHRYALIRLRQVLNA